MEQELDYKELESQRKAEVEAQVKAYLDNQKERMFFYLAEGTGYEDRDVEKSGLLHFTDEEIDRIQALTNSDSTVSDPLLIGEELRSLLSARCEDADVFPTTIDFSNRYCFYKFSGIIYNQREGRLNEQETLNIALLDQDYAELLTQQILDRHNFNFNRLLTLNPELARKINTIAENCIYRYMPYEYDQIPNREPFIILFDEVKADAEVIDGPLGGEIVLYDGDAADKYITVNVSVASRNLTITEKMTDIDGWEVISIEHVDADKVMNLLHAEDYFDMLNKLQQMFNDENAYFKIRHWLSKNNLKFEESHESYSNYDLDDINDF